MKAVILAAGIGTRLSPYTDKLPKCLLRVNGITILEHQLNALFNNKLKNVVLVLGHQKEKILQFLSHHAFNEFQFEIVINKAYMSTNSSYSLWLAKDRLYKGFIYINSDLIFHPNLIIKLLHHNCHSGIIVDKTPINSNDDMFKIKIKHNRIISFDKNISPKDAAGRAIGPAKFDSNMAPIYLDKLDQIIGTDKNKWVYTSFNEFSKDYSIHAIDNDELYWAEIDTFEDLENANKIFKKISQSY